MSIAHRSCYFTFDSIFFYFIMSHQDTLHDLVNCSANTPLILFLSCVQLNVLYFRPERLSSLVNTYSMS